MSVYNPDAFSQVKGFTIEIDGAAGSSEDTSWESVTVGARSTYRPGDVVYGEVKFRGAVAGTRAELCRWLNETTSGKPSKRNVSITPMHLDGTIGETVTYIDCVITAYTPPRLVTPDQGNPCGPHRFEEEVRFIYRDWTIRA